MPGCLGGVGVAVADADSVDGFWSTGVCLCMLVSLVRIMFCLMRPGSRGTWSPKDLRHGAESGGEESEEGGESHFRLVVVFFFLFGTN